MPPPISDANPFISEINDCTPEGEIPVSESLMDTYERLIPYFRLLLKSCILELECVLVVGHSNTLRVIVQYLDLLPRHQVEQLMFGHSDILLYELNNSGMPIDRRPVVDRMLFQ